MLALRTSLALIPLFASLAMYAEVSTPKAPDSSSDEPLGVGDTAPDWELPGSDGKTYRLSDLLQERAVVLAWYPRAFTRGCTIECKSLKEQGHLIREFNVDYFMASVDPIEQQKGFAEQQGADFPLLADETRETATAYGVMADQGYSKRQTFYIGMDGKVLHVDRAVNPKTAAEDIATVLATLDVKRKESGD